MKTVYLIRHGRPDFPPDTVMSLGKTDIPLCAQGYLQAETAAKILEGKEFTLFSSPLIRAVQTAQAFHRPIRILDGLQELDAGEWDGLTFDEIRVRFPELYAARETDRTIPLPGAEDHAAGLRRFRSAMEAAAESAPGDVAVVAHSGVMGLFLKEVAGRWNKPAYGQILRFTYENKIFTLMEEDYHA